LKKKDFIGISLEKNKLYTAHFRKIKGQLELINLETVELPDIVEARARPRLGDFKPGPKADTPKGDDALFGLVEESDDFSGLDLDDSDFGQIADDLDDTKLGEEDSEEETNEQFLSNYFSKYGKNALQLGLTIPQGKTIFQQLEAVNLNKMKKKEQKEYVAELLDPMYEDVISEDQYAWEVDENGDGWLVSYDNDHSLINLVDLAEITYEGTTTIREHMPEEAVWIGLVRSHYTLKEDQITGLVSIGERSSRLMFLKGSELFHVLPVINEGSKSRNVLQTLFSKLLFEIDKGTLPALDQMIIMQSTKPGTEVVDFFKDQFIDVRVEMFRPNPKKMRVPEELVQNPEALRPYVTAIGAAQAATGFDTAEWPPFSLVPEYVRERQQLFKLEWHGMALLVCIALAPLLINYWYQGYVSERDELLQTVQTIDMQIAQTQPVARDVEQMLEEQAVVREMNDRIVNLSRNNLFWSETLRQINEGVARVPNTWLTSLRVSGEDMDIEGYSLYRNRIPLAARVFDDARIISVAEAQLRDANVLQFNLRIHNYMDDEERFTPQVPEPDEDVIQEIEIPQLAQ